ncbi:LOB domain-containing protein 40-like [Triticum urartu]|uniref:LOB domain-containing protein n=1 Tax=Triticum urartu TaxID=4572 RepID=A0A8R7TSR6_TRIUA|nr:LOB domain-containing protein 40-like [Triticum urartu]
MRMSCNGCRVLRKGCGEGCTIRPCLEWIRSADAQANATVFLAKFYGRAGLLNLLAADDAALRPALFRSLLYEACGRMVNPVYGSVGLLWSGQWGACQAAVEAVLKGRPIVRVTSDAPLTACDIRHVAKADRPAAATDALLGVSRAGRTGFKRASSSTAKSKSKSRTSSGAKRDDGLDQAPSHEESAGSHDHGSHVEDDGMAVEQTRGEESSEGTEVDAGSHVSQAEDSPVPPVAAQDEEAHDDEIGLELTLGFQRVVARSPPAGARFGASSSSAESSHIGLLLELPVS